ncbi:MAG: DUF6084 family protein [Actinomycetota bacterium]|nr:DUF6084 family protein [Actinomycetota bacterium]MDQ2847125.1 DUF6084 family protein [Actinomycetota bacterium]MDQ2955707.1 DUF6084 family protein [Actinomycetota bacterium]
MTELEFAIADLFAEPYAVAPQLTARLRITEATGARIHAIALRAQVRIEPQRRAYTADEEGALLDLFGARERWYDTLKPFMWMQASAMVQGFSEITEVDLALPCSYDFEVTASKYLHALRDGAISVVLLFSGTVFIRGERGFGVEQVPWDREARWEMPISVWRTMMDLYYPGTGWLRLDRDLIEQLARYKAEHGLTTWDETLRSLLPDADRTLS